MFYTCAMDAVEKRIAELGLTMPTPPQPAGTYEPVVESGAMLYVSGQIAKRDGMVMHAGRLGEAVGIEEGKEAAAAALLGALAAIRAQCGSLSVIERIVQVRGFVSSAQDFTQQPAVVDGASQLLIDIFGEAGRHARLAVGVPSLPLNACVEIEMLCQRAIKDAYKA